MKNHPFTRGFLCPKLNHRELLLYHPERLKNALIRIGPKGKNKFKPIALPKAISLITERMKRDNTEHDPSSIVTAYYAGNNGILSKYAPLRFFSKLGATITSEGICNEAGCNALKELFGTYSTTNPLQILNPKNRLIVVWGTNLYERNNHAYSLVKKAVKNGSKVVVVNPIKTRLAYEADIHVQPYPGMDLLISKYILNKIISSRVHDANFLNSHVNYQESLLSTISSTEAETIISQSGVERIKLDKLIDLLSIYKHSTIFIIGFGVQKYFNGGIYLKAIALIQIILGNMGKPGTGLLYSQSGFNQEYSGLITDHVSRMKDLSYFNNIPLATLGSSLTDKKYKILFVYNFNPASSLPDQNAVKKSLKREDLFVVVLDMFLNETTRYADIVIPAKFDLECNDLITSYGFPGLAVNQKGPCPYSECVSNYEFIQQLVKKLGWKGFEFIQESEDNIIEQCIEILPDNIKKDVLSKGYHVPLEFDDIPFKDLYFPTVDGKIHLNDKSLVSALSTSKKPIILAKNEFYLLSPSHQYFIHSQFSRIHSEFKEMFQKIYINEVDIRILEMQKNQEVLVSNEFGEAKMILDCNNDLKPGIALIYSGAPFITERNINANIFTPNDPEESCLSGSYFSTKVRIMKI